LIVQGLPQVRASNPRVNFWLFIATLFSVLLVSCISYNTNTQFSSNPVEAAIQFIVGGLPFALSLLAILGCHEFGHYLAGRYHGVHVTLPYFIPVPIPGTFGTLGAFINMKEPPRNRNILLDIGIAGPLAGLVVAIPILLIGLMLSPVTRTPLAPAAGQMFSLEGNSILYLLAKLITKGQLLPAPVSYGGVAPLLYWIRFIFTSQPYPLGGLDVTIHPMALAGWAGLLVTALNLIPAGQLDGGHMLYVLVGRKWASRLLPFILVGLIALGFVWNGWWLWAAMIFFLGRAYAEPLDQITPLDRRRRALAVLALLIFIMVFTPVPFTTIASQIQ
jgi:membrane-associated protease RseP (regulator of RpoE activity)